MDEGQLPPEEKRESAPLTPEPAPAVPPPAPTMPGPLPGTMKRLMRSRRDRVLAGVCGGIGQYFGVDPLLIRALWVFVTLVTWGVGVILYVLAAIVIPENLGAEPEPTHRLPIQGNVFWGGLLVLAGLYFLANAIGGHILPSWLWGAVRASAVSFVLIATGLIIIFTIARRNGGEARRLTRSREGRMIGGVCAGLGRYFKVDPTWVRLVWVVLTLLSVGIAAVLYLVAMIAIPEE